MSLIFEKIKNPVYADAGKKLINCEVKFPALGDEYVPFTASANDTEAHGREIFAQCVAGKWGKVKDYAAPVKSAEQLAAEALAEKRYLQSEAEGVIAPLERAVRLGMATDEEKRQLGAWETYSVLLNRVSHEDVANITWPERPE